MSFKSEPCSSRSVKCEVKVEPMEVDLCPTDQIEIITLDGTDDEENDVTFMMAKWYCYVCNTTVCGGSFANRYHLRTKRHNKNFRYAHRFGTRKWSRKNFTKKKEPKIIGRHTRWCRFCDITCSGLISFKDHLRSKRHIRYQKLTEGLQKSAQFVSWDDDEEI